MPNSQKLQVRCSATANLEPGKGAHWRPPFCTTASPVLHARAGAGQEWKSNDLSEQAAAVPWSGYLCRCRQCGAGTTKGDRCRHVGRAPARLLSCSTAPIHARSCSPIPCGRFASATSPATSGAWLVAPIAKHKWAGCSKRRAPPQGRAAPRPRRAPELLCKPHQASRRPGKEAGWRTCCFFAVTRTDSNGCRQTVVARGAAPSAQFWKS